MIQSFIYFLVFLSWTNNFIFVDGFVSINSKSRITASTTTIRNSSCGVTRRSKILFEDESIYDNGMTKQKNHMDSTTSCINHNIIMNRRKAIVSPLVSLVCGMSLQQQPANAVITDETDNFGDNWWAAPSTPTTQPRSSSSSQQAQAQQLNTVTTPPPSDEITIQIPKSDLQSKQGLGIELGEIEFRTNRRVYIKSVLSGSVADKLGIKKDWVVVSINGDVRSKKNLTFG